MIVKVTRADSVKPVMLVTPDKKHGRPHTMGTVMLANVSITDDAIRGELVSEASEVYSPTGPLTKVLRKAKPNTRGSFKAAYLAGSTLYVRK